MNDGPATSPPISVNTVTVTVPVPGGAIPVHSVADVQLTAVAACCSSIGPKKNSVPLGVVSKATPRNVTGVPPAAGPLVGLTSVNASPRGTYR